MTSLNREDRYSEPSTALRFIVREYIRSHIHTCVPAVVETYDPATRRVRACVALRQVMTDGETHVKSPVLDVPVIFPAGGGFTFLVPLAAGDMVLLLFSERGIGAWKESFAVSTPEPGQYFDEADAVAVAGFGPLEVSPATETGAVLQNIDGTQSVRIEPDRIEIHSDAAVKVFVPDNGNVYLGGEADAQELATKGFVEQQYNAHIHVTPAGNTGPPLTASPLIGGVDITKKTKSE